MSEESFDIRRFVIIWNNKYPLDLWWRKKYNIPFNSEQHRRISLIDIAFQRVEDLWVSDLISKDNNDIPQSEQMTDEDFDKVDIDSFNKESDANIQSKG
jgi:hypothetical protein